MFDLAYIDPAAGTLILQALVGGILAGLVTLRFYWSKVKQFFTRGNTQKDGDSDG